MSTKQIEYVSEDWHVFCLNGKLLHTATSENSAQAFIDRLYPDDPNVAIYGVQVS